MTKESETDPETRVGLGGHGPLVRFHANDFTDRIDTTYYELFPDDA